MALYRVQVWDKTQVLVFAVTAESEKDAKEKVARVCPLDGSQNVYTTKLDGDAELFFTKVEGKDAVFVGLKND